MNHSLGSLLPFSGKPWASVILEEEGESWSFAADRGVPGLGRGDRDPRGELSAFCSRVRAGQAPGVAVSLPCDRCDR